MRTLEQNIDIFIENQIPSFYLADNNLYGGKLLVEFIKEYYRWLHSSFVDLYVTSNNNPAFLQGDLIYQTNGKRITGRGVVEYSTESYIQVSNVSGNFNSTNTIISSTSLRRADVTNVIVNDEIGYKTRKLLEYGDIDLTTTDLLDRLKKKYIADLPSDIIADKRLLIKNALDFYRNKGNEKSYDILFRALFDKDVTVYLPGRDILRLSDGEWNVPQYLEVSYVPDLQTYVNRKIIGIGSKASAIIENYQQLVVNRKTIEILTISNVNGFFDRGEYIRLANSTDIENIPKILGSLTGVSVIDGGAEFAIGDILDISGNGRSGKARVVNTISDDGKVNFELISPGSGYSKTTIPIIYPRVTLTLSSGNNNISSGQLLYQADNLANGIVYTNSTNEVVIKEISSGFTIGSSIKTALLMNIGKLANTVNNIAVGDVISQYNGATKIANGIIGAIETNTNNTSIIVIDTLGSFTQSFYTGTRANNVIITSNTSVNCYVYSIIGGSNTGSGVITDIEGGGTGASFRIGDIYDTEYVSINTNYVRDILTYSVYSFNGVSDTSNTIINNLLNYELNEVGKIQYLHSIVPGSGYSLNPFVTLNYYPMSSLQIEDLGGIKGNNAVVTSTAGIADGVVTSLALVDSGYGYEPGEYVNMQKSGSSFSVTGRALVLNQGKAEGEWKSTRGFLNSDKKIQDSRYYQEYSYELQSDINYHRYNDVVRKLVHPIGTEMFGKFLLTTTLTDDESELTESTLELIGNGTVTCLTSNVVTGNNTVFTSFFANNDVIKINSYERTITYIANNTYLTLDTAILNSYTSNTYSKIRNY